MDINELAEHTRFHDADLTVMQMVGDHVHLQFEDVCIDIESDDLYSVTIDLTGVQQVTCNENIVQEIKIEGEGSSVLQFRRFADRVELASQWHSYSKRLSECHTYVFKFKFFNITTKKQTQELSQSMTRLNSVCYGTR